MTGPLIERVRAAFLAGDVTGADVMLRERLAVSPDDREARIELARLLHYRGHYLEALGELQRVPPADGSVEPLLEAALLSRLGRHEEAAAVQRFAIERDGEHPRALLGLAHYLKTLGKFDESAAASRRALAIDPGLGEAWWNLANLKTGDISDDDRVEMEALLLNPALTEDGRAHVHFALARALDMADDPASSWAHLAEGNRIRAVQSKYRPEGIGEMVDATIGLMTADFFSARANWGDPSRAPIFIVGVPRSGSTLLEQMLASHSQIEGTSELPDIPALVRQVGGTERYGNARYLGRLEQLSADDVRALGSAYLDRARPQRQLGRPFFVDKMPNNWLFAGFIHLILPNARIIDMRRHPLDCGLSNFRELFARGQAYSYDLAHIGRHYRDYVRLMDHFDQVQPGSIRRLIYERLVEDPEGQLRELFDDLDLEFEDRILRFHQTDRAVRTASSAQVRQPLNRKGIGQWRRYESWLGPLRDSIGPVLDRWDKAQKF